METKTFRGLSLAEVEAKVRAELGKAAAEQRAAQAAAAEFIPDALAAAAKVEAAVSEPKNDLAALFAPDAPKAEIAWPDDEPVAVAPLPAPLPEPEILPAPIAG